MEEERQSDMDRPSLPALVCGEGDVMEEQQEQDETPNAILCKVIG